MIIDKKSIISLVLLKQIKLRLLQTLQGVSMFGGINIILYGDFF